MINLIESILIIISTIIGLGVFVLPYAFLKSGIFYWLWFVLVILSFFILHFAYSEIIFQVKKKHNLPGLAAEILGEKFKKYIWFIDFTGTQLVFWAYLIAIPNILNPIISIDPFFIKLLTAIFVILIIFLKINPFTKLDSLLSILLLLIFIFLTINFLPQIKIENITHISPTNPLISYGILIFSFTGYSSLQIVYDLIGIDKKKFFIINLVSLLLVGLLYALFTISIVGILGNKVSPETTSALKGTIADEFLTLIVILALLNIFTTFIALAFYLKRGLITDFNLNENLSWFLTSLPILIFSFLAFNNLAKLISTIGSLFIGFNVIVIFICYLKLKQKDFFVLPKSLILLSTLFYVIGLIIGILAEFLG